MTQFEREVEVLITDVLAAHQTMLKEVGLRADFRGIRVEKALPEARTSEAEVHFYRGQDFVDIFEFFVMEDGEPAASLYEIKEWFEQQLGEFPARHGGGLGRRG